MAEEDIAYPTPSAEAEEWLRNNPDRLTDFNYKFGVGVGEEILGIQIEQPAATEAAVEQEDSAAVDIAKGVAEGVLGAVRETGQFVDGISDAASGFFDRNLGGSQIYRDNESPIGISFGTQEERDEALERQNLQDVGLQEFAVKATIFDQERDTIAGSITQGMSQFLTGYFTGGGPRTFLGALGKGAVVDAVVFDPYEANLSAVLAEMDWAEPYVIEALKTDPNDSEWENRLRNSLEGGALGLGTEAVVKMVKFVAVGRKAKTEISELGNVSSDTASELDEIAKEIQALNVEQKGPVSKLTARPDGTFTDPVTNQSYAPKGESLEALEVPTELPEVRVAGPSSSLEPPAATDSPVRPEAPIVRPEVQTETASPEPQATDASPLPPAAKELADQIAPAEVPIKPKVPLVDKTQLRMALDNAASMDDMDVLAVDTSLAFNYRRFTSEDASLTGAKVIQAFDEVLRDTGVKKAMRLHKPETHEKVTKDAIAYLAEATETAPNTLVRDLNLTQTVTTDMTQKLVAGKMAMQSTAREINLLASKVDEAFNRGQADEALERQLFDLMQMHLEIQASVKGIQTAAARATSAGRIYTSDVLEDGALDTMAAFGGSEKIRKLAKQLRRVKDDKGTAKMVRKAMDRKWMGVLNEYWINQILSGYKTHALNMTSNAMNLFLLPAERMVGGTVDGLKTGDYTQALQAVKQYRYMMSSMFEGIQLAATAGYRENAVLDNALKVDVPSRGTKQISAKNFGIENTRIGSAVDIMGKFFRLPSRLLLSEDEFFKQVAFRARLKAILDVEASRMSADDFKKMGYSDKKTYMEGEFDKAFLSKIDLEEKWQELVLTGRVADEADAKAAFIEEQLGSYNAGNANALSALREARSTTFTTPLAKGTVSYDFQLMANRHPWLRQLTPFIQTPVNVITTAFDRTPVLNLLRQQYRSALTSPDEAVRAEAYGKLATGTVLVSIIGALAYEGKITGGGPADPRQAKNWKASKDWQPYSVNFGTQEKPNWISIQRLDPHGFLFGIIGDIVEMQQMIDNSPEFDAQPLIAMTIAAVGNNIVSKTYMQGIADTVSMFESKDQPWKVTQFLNQKAASLVPYSSMQSQLGAATDENMREIRTLVDAIKSKSFFHRSELSVKHDWLTGEALTNPEHMLGYIQVKKLEAKNSQVARVQREIRKLGYGFMGPDKKIGSVTLSTGQYQDWNRLMGSIEIGGRTLVQSLAREMDKSRYKGGPNYGIVTPQESHRVAMLSRVTQRYKARAKRILLREHPDLKEAVRTYDRFKKSAQGGRDVGERPVLDMNLQ